jgi:hypothetical protein
MWPNIKQEHRETGTVFLILNSFIHFLLGEICICGKEVYKEIHCLNLTALCLLLPQIFFWKHLGGL